MPVFGLADWYPSTSRGRDPHRRNQAIFREKSFHKEQTQGAPTGYSKSLLPLSTPQPPPFSRSHNPFQGWDFSHRHRSKEKTPQCPSHSQKRNSTKDSRRKSPRPEPHSTVKLSSSNSKMTHLKTPSRGIFPTSPRAHRRPRSVSRLPCGSPSRYRRVWSMPERRGPLRIRRLSVGR